jgi:hypothetical protein
MLIETLKEECAKRNIKTATGLHDCMKREIDAKYSYSTINDMWNNGKGKLSTFKDALASIGVTSVKFK